MFPLSPPATKVLLPNMIVYKFRDSPSNPDVLEVQEVPSEEEKIIPSLPTVTKLLFPYMIPVSRTEVPDVLEVHEVPSDEVRMVPDDPVATKVLLP